MTEIESERLILRQWRQNDLADWTELCADPNFWHFPYRRAFTPQESQERLAKFVSHWEDHGFGMWAATLKDDGTLVGNVGLAIPSRLPEVLPAVEVAWRLGSAWWGKGLATEAARAAVAFGFTHLGLERIISILEAENTRSMRVVEKLGMQWERQTVHPELGLPLVVYQIELDSWTDSV